MQWDTKEIVELNSKRNQLKLMLCMLPLQTQITIKLR
jgi:hypothetical protein